MKQVHKTMSKTLDSLERCLSMVFGVMGMIELLMAMDLFQGRDEGHTWKPKTDKRG